MNIEDIKFKAKEVNRTTRNIEIMSGYFSVVRSLVHKERTIQDKAMVLYLALENDGMLQVFQDQLDEISTITNEADNFIFTVAENLENKKLVFNPGGASDGK